MSPKDLCKLEIVRQDKKSDWYEVRSSMRLVWLKAKQEIVPVEVICSFQKMHCDGPAGSANSIVARLQRVRAVTESQIVSWGTARVEQSGSFVFGVHVPTSRPTFSKHMIVQAGCITNHTTLLTTFLCACHTFIRLRQAAAIIRSPLTDGHHHSARASGVIRGFCVNSASKGGSRAEGGGGNSLSSGGGDAASSTDYGGGASSGSLSGNGADNNNKEDGEEKGQKTMSGGRTSRKRARVVCVPVAVPCRDEKNQRWAVVEEMSGGGGTEGGQAPVGGARHTGSGPTSRELPPTARRLAMSAKKTILFRHGFDSSKADSVARRAK